MDISDHLTDQNESFQKIPREIVNNITVENEGSSHSTVSSVISSNDNDLEDLNKPDLIGELIYISSAERNMIDSDDKPSETEDETQNEINKIHIKNQYKNFEKLSKSMEQNKAKWKKLEESLNPLTDDDDAHSKIINWRINELQSMCSKTIRPEYILDSLNPDLQHYVMSLISISREEFEQEIRNSWTSIDWFRYAVRMVQMISFIGKSHVRYPWWKESDNSGYPETIINKDKSLIKYSIKLDLRLNLTTNPRFRTKSEIRQIIWFMQTVEAFTDLFPKEMETELARCISYEIYEDNRVVMFQDSVPQKLYHILMGKMEMVYVYKLMQGEVHKSMGFLTHNQTNNLVDFQNNLPSATYFIARGQLEVLTLHKEDYLRLSSQSNLEPIQTFLQNLSIFKSFDISESTFQKKMIKIQYFKNDKVISQDPINDSFFYVIKSGNVAVTRNQGVYDSDLSHLWNSNSVYSLGCKREGSHASKMIQINDRQVTINSSETNETISEISPELDEESSFYQNSNQVKPHTSIGTRTNRHSDQQKLNDRLSKSRTIMNMKITKETRQIKTKVTSVPILTTKRPAKKERITYIKLDTLKVLDVFGLETLEKEESTVKSNFILISEGAEVIMIKKRYFLQHIDNNTLLEIRNMVKSYIGEEETKHLIDDEKKWKAYKKILMQKMIALHC